MRGEAASAREAYFICSGTGASRSVMPHFCIQSASSFCASSAASRRTSGEASVSSTWATVNSPLQSSVNCTMESWSIQKWQNQTLPPIFSIAVWAILYLRFWQAGGKVLDVDQARSAQTTALALDEVHVLQFPEQLDRLMLGAAEGFLHFPDGVDDIHPTLLVQPAVLCRQAHAVQQDAVQRSGIGGELPETVVLEQCLWDAEIGEQFARLTIEVVVTHGINGSSTHGLRHLSYTGLLQCHILPI